jgi:hypothetical protein
VAGAGFAPPAVAVKESPIASVTGTTTVVDPNEILMTPE